MTYIRYFDSDEKQDIKALREITSNISKNYRSWMDDIRSLTRADIKDWAEENGSGRYHPKLFAVINEDVPKENEIQGFVYAYPEEEKFAINYIKKHQLLDPYEYNRLIYEISYAKHPNGLPGQISQVLPLVCAKLCKIMRIPLSKRTGQPLLTITAYTFADNIPSVKILEKTGFERRGAMPEYRGATRMIDMYALNWQKHRDLIASSSLYREGMSRPLW